MSPGTGPPPDSTRLSKIVVVLDVEADVLLVGVDCSAWCAEQGAKSVLVQAQLCHYGRSPDYRKRKILVALWAIVLVRLAVLVDVCGQGLRRNVDPK